MNFKLNMTEAAFLALLSSAGLFVAGYGYGNHRAVTVNPQSQRDQVVCLMPQDVAKVIKKRPVS
ncbi:MAG: hypothetical protein HC771_16365 [Synechococcales cyanobacterium CRU_2_2]|nr:hypothetical protein [Synechococcales cyanobacterium CRU_2_2]